MKCFCNALRICGECKDVIITRPRQLGYAQQAHNYVRMTRNQRLVYAGEHYAKPMPVSEYLCQIVRQSESV